LAPRSGDTSARSRRPPRRGDGRWPGRCRASLPSPPLRAPPERSRRPSLAGGREPVKRSAFSPRYTGCPGGRPMAYIREIPLDELSDKARELYEKNQAQLGYVPNYLKAFAHRPEVLTAWAQLLGAIRSNLDQRRYELVTLAAAGALRSTYCILAHSAALLRSQIFTEDEIGAIARDYRTAPITRAEIAMMAFAEKVTREAHSVTAADLDELRRHGFADAEILDIVLAA